MNFQDLLQAATNTAYPEPDTPLHSDIIPKVVPLFYQHCPSPARVLDIGCGSCAGAKLLRETGYDVVPISILQSEVDAAQALGFPSIRCEMHNTDLLGHFDAVWLRHAAEHSPCPLLLLMNLREQADWLYLEVPLPETSCRHELNPNHYSVLSVGGWSNLLNRAGWQVVETQAIKFQVQTGMDFYSYFICK